MPACKKNNPTPATTPAPQASVVGTWTINSIYESSVINSQGSQDPNPNINGSATLSFANNNTYISTNTDFTRIGTPAAATNDNGTYSQPDSLLISSNVSGYTIKAKVIKITSSELWIRYQQVYMVHNYYECHFSR